MPKKKAEATLDNVLAAYKKKYGEEAIRKGNEIPNPTRISTGSLELDVAMGTDTEGEGGVPLGRWSRFWGAKSTGKSLVAWEVIKSAQQKGMTCAYYNIEGQFHQDFVRDKGINVNDLHIVEGVNIEQLCTFLEGSLPHIDIHIFDSCSAASSTDELGAAMEDRRRGAKAAAWQWGFEKASAHFDVTHNAVIYIDQVRTKSMTGAALGDNFKPPGGEFLSHHSSMTAKFVQGAWLFRRPDGALSDDNSFARQTMSGQMENDGMEVKVRIEKSRVGRPLRTATMWLDYGQMEFDQAYEYKKFGEHQGLITRSGSWYNIDGHKKQYQGESAVRKAIKEDKNLQEEIRRRALNEEEEQPDTSQEGE